MSRARLLSRHMTSSAAAAAAAAAPSNIQFHAVTPTFTVAVLDRPSKLNSLDLQMVRDLHQKLLTPAPLKGVLWLQGAGERAFCAGGDVASIQKQVVQRQGSIPSDFFFEEYHLDYDLAALPGLVQVSVWNGVTMGGGVGLSIHGRFRVATERTVFSMPETGIGFFPDVGTTHALPRLRAGPEVGLYLALTGSRLGPGDCLLTGVATHYVPSARLERVKAELQALQDATPDMVHEVLAGAAADSGRDVKATLEPHLDAIRRCFSRPTAEQILQALKDEGTEWAQTTHKQISQGSPLSVKVTMRALARHGRPDVSLKRALAEEYRMSQRFMTMEADFVEGVRAVLVDKDQKPKWRHAGLEAVSDADVDRFFLPLDKAHPRGELWG